MSIYLKTFLFEIFARVYIQYAQQQTRDPIKCPGCRGGRGKALNIPKTACCKRIAVGVEVHPFRPRRFHPNGIRLISLFLTRRHTKTMEICTAPVFRRLGWTAMRVPFVFNVTSSHHSKVIGTDFIIRPTE